MKKIKLYTLPVLLALLVFIIYQNATIVNIKLLFWSIDTSRSLMTGLFLLIGTLIGWMLRGAFARWRQVRLDKKQIKASPQASKNEPPAEQGGA